MNASLLGAKRAKLGGVYFTKTNLTGARLAFDPNSLPDAGSFGSNDTLFQANLNKPDPALLRQMEDQAKTKEQLLAVKQLTVLAKRADLDGQGRWEKYFNCLLFDVTCEYGLKPTRLLHILGVSLFVFALIYVHAQQTSSWKSGIWLVRDEDRILDKKETEDARLKDGFRRSNPSDTWLGRMVHVLGLNVVGLALWFSLLSATRIGYDALNFGLWFSRMQPREYTLRGTGSVRFFSGLQSLLSVYLIALWILTYFSRPFE